jgi:hypothetical protein
MRAYRHSRDRWDWEAGAMPLPANQRGNFRRFWRYCWGLVFVCVMAILSEWGPRIMAHKAVGASVTAKHDPVTYAVK